MRETAAMPDPRSASSAHGWLVVVALVAAAALISSLAGGFGTGDLPVGMRLFVFTVTIAVNAAKWSAWVWLMRRFVPERTGPLLAGGLAGAVLLNLTLPFELELAFAALGLAVDLPYGQVYSAAIVIATLVYGVIMLVTARRAETSEEAPGGSPEVPLFLAKLGIVDLGALLAVRAEDHYLRLHLADERTPLILYRFGDAVRQLGGIDGVQVHRGCWVARRAVAESLRDGRRWRLRLTDGTIVPVSESRVGAARAAGLIGGRGA